MRSQTPPPKIFLKKYVANLMDPFVSRLHINKRSIRILQYHNITDEYVPREWEQMTTPRGLFDRQMSYLKSENFNVIGVEEVLELLVTDTPIPSRTVCVTFDDGFKDNYINAFPIMEKYGLKGTIFLTASFIGRKNRFGEYLSWPEIMELHSGNVITFGCHSFSHKNLATLSRKELIEEIRTTKDILQNKLNAKIDIFAYPYGWYNSFNKRVINILKEEGFLCAFTGIYGANTKKSDLYQLRRTGVSWFDELDEFGRMLRGSYDWYRIYQRIDSLWKKAILQTGI